MRRLLIFAVLAGGMLVALRMLSERVGPAIREQCSEMCDHFLAGMPESFPPNRMMTDLEALNEKTDRILEALEENKAVDGPQE